MNLLNLPAEPPQRIGRRSQMIIGSHDPGPAKPARRVLTYWRFWKNSRFIDGSLGPEIVKGGFSELRTLADGREVVLYLESHRPRGTFGRILAHVELPDGSSLNEALLAAGLARVDERWPHALLGRYAQLERGARREGVGIWQTGPS